MRYLVLICMLGLFVGCSSIEDRTAKRAAEKDAKRVASFKAKFSEAYQFFSDGLAEENFMKIETCGRLLETISIPEGVKDQSEMDSEVLVRDLAKTLGTFASTYQRTLADRVSIEAGATTYLKEEDLKPKIEEIMSSFKELDKAFDLGLSF
ncbi:MAG: hypothetical protein AAFN77_13385 [Planctomycetota bacterium]